MNTFNQSRIMPRLPDFCAAVLLCLGFTHIGVYAANPCLGAIPRGVYDTYSINQSSTDLASLRAYFQSDEFRKHAEQSKWDFKGVADAYGSINADSSQSELAEFQSHISSMSDQQFERWAEETVVHSVVNVQALKEFTKCLASEKGVARFSVSENEVPQLGQVVIQVIYDLQPGEELPVLTSWKALGSKSSKSTSLRLNERIPKAFAIEAERTGTNGLLFVIETTKGVVIHETDALSSRVATTTTITMPLERHIIEVGRYNVNWAGHNNGLDIRPAKPGEASVTRIWSVSRADTGLPFDWIEPNSLKVEYLWTDDSVPRCSSGFWIRPSNKGDLSATIQGDILAVSMTWAVDTSKNVSAVIPPWNPKVLISFRLRGDYPRN